MTDRAMQNVLGQKILSWNFLVILALLRIRYRRRGCKLNKHSLAKWLFILPTFPTPLLVTRLKKIKKNRLFSFQSYRRNPISPSQPFF